MTFKNKEKDSRTTTMSFIPSLKASRIGKKVFRPSKERNSEGGTLKRKEGPISAIRKSFRKTRGGAKIKAGSREAVFEQGEFTFRVDSAIEKKIQDQGRTGTAAHGHAGADQRLLDSFRMRKNAEWRECWKRDEILNLPYGNEEKLREVFALTRRLLSDAVGRVSDRLIRDDSLLESALVEVHKRLPLPVRLILPKKRYIELLMANRERLLP